MRAGSRVAVTVAIVAALSACAPSGASQSTSYVAPRTADGVPDLNGVWQALNTANYDIQAHPARPALAIIPAAPRTGTPGLVRATHTDLPALALRPLGAVGGVPAGAGVVEGDEIPYQPWALAKKKENAEHWLERDPEIKCFMPGVPRATYMPYPFQILQSTNTILIAYEFAGTTRTIHLDTVGNSPSPSWMGWSRGRWEGDTLVVEVTDFNEETWFDRAGNFHSDALHVVERYTPVEPGPSDVRGDHRGPEGLHPSVEDAYAAVPAFRARTRSCSSTSAWSSSRQLMYGQLGVIDPATGTVNK